MLVAENPLSPGNSFCNREDICSMAPFPQSLYGNFPTRNARCRNKEIIVPITDAAARYWLRKISFFYGLYCFSIILIYIHLHFVIC